MHAERKDFTEYFRALHSDQAEKVLKSFPIVSQGPDSADSKQYMAIYDKVQPFFKPRWEIEALLMILVGGTFVMSCFTSIGVLSILGFAFSQAVIGWMGHSMAHNRDPTLRKVGSWYAALFGGFSL